MPRAILSQPALGIGESGLTITDDDNNMLATMTFSGSAFSGTSAGGMPVKLSR